MMSKTFYEVFSSNMKILGLPVPETMFGTVTTALGTIGTIAGAIAKIGTSATVSELFLTIPLSAGAVATASAVGEIIAVAGACSAAFYIGACIGSALIAAYETLVASELTKVANWAADLANRFGSTISQFIAYAVQQNSELSPVRKKLALANLTQFTPVFTTASTVPGVFA